MGNTPVQNPGYFGGPANTNENNQLNQLENDGSYGTTPSPSPDPTPDPTPDSSPMDSSDSGDSADTDTV